jgi:hypothetical protein
MVNLPRQFFVSGRNSDKEFAHKSKQVQQNMYGILTSIQTNELASFLCIFFESFLLSLIFVDSSFLCNYFFLIRIPPWIYYLL